MVAGKFCSLLLLISQRLQKNNPSQLHLPTEMWHCISNFCVMEYVPRVEVITDHAGVDELEPSYAIHKEQIERYDEAYDKLEKDFHCI